MPDGIPKCDSKKLFTNLGSSVAFAAFQKLSETHLLFSLHHLPPKQNKHLYRFSFDFGISF